MDEIFPDIDSSAADQQPSEDEANIYNLSPDMCMVSHQTLIGEDRGRCMNKGDESGDCNNVSDTDALEINQDDCNDQTALH